MYAEYHDQWEGGTLPQNPHRSEKVHQYSYYSVTINYNDLLKQLKTLLPTIGDDIYKLRELNTILNSLNYVSEDKKIIKNLDSSIMETLAACMYLDETKRINKSFDY